MTAKISDCKKGSRRKIKQVISVESEREGGRWEAAMRSEAATFLSSCKRLCFQSHVCRAYKDTRRGRCCVAAMHSEKWWLYVNYARVDRVSVYQVVISSFIRQTQPYHFCTSAPTFAVVYLSLYFLLIQLLIFPSASLSSLTRFSFYP